MHILSSFVQQHLTHVLHLRILLVFLRRCMTKCWWVTCVRLMIVYDADFSESDAVSNKAWWIHEVCSNLRSILLNATVSAQTLDRQVPIR